MYKTGLAPDTKHPRPGRTGKTGGEISRVIFWGRLVPLTCKGVKKYTHDYEARYPAE